MFTVKKFIAVVSAIIIGVTYLFLVALSILAFNKWALLVVIVSVSCLGSFLLGYWVSCLDFEEQERNETRYVDELRQFP